MKKNLVIHIGNHKTASTSLQDFMVHNSARLNSRGIYYPLFSEVMFDVHRKQINGRLLFNSKLQKVLGKEIRRFIKSKYHTMILSDENLYWEEQGLLLEFIRQYEDQVEIQIVCYMREQISYLLSFWKFISYDDTIQGKVVPSFEDLIQQSPEDPSSHLIIRSAKIGYEKLSKIVDLLGRDRIHLRAFHMPFLQEGSIEKDFFSLLSFDLDGFEFLPPSNVSPNMRQAQKLAYLNRLIGHKKTRVACAQCILTEDQGDESLISEAELELLLSCQMAWFDRIRKEFFEDPDCFGDIETEWRHRINHAQGSRRLSERDKDEIKRLILIKQMDLFLEQADRISSDEH